MFNTVPGPKLVFNTGRAIECPVLSLLGPTACNIEVVPTCGPLSLSPRFSYGNTISWSSASFPIFGFRRHLCRLHSKTRVCLGPAARASKYPFGRWDQGACHFVGKSLGSQFFKEHCIFATSQLKGEQYASVGRGKASQRVQQFVHNIMVQLSNLQDGQLNNSMQPKARILVQHR